MKIWHDDIRKPPDDSWFWVRTNSDAIKLLSDPVLKVEEISLDHDLGLHDGDPDAPGAVFEKGQAEENGLDLVKFMCNNRLVPHKVTIHSWNPIGAMKMAQLLNDEGYNCVVKPFRLERR